MAGGTLRDLYQAELTDLYNAEQRIVASLPTLASKVRSPELRAALERHVERTRIHIERLDLLFTKFALPKSDQRVSPIDELVRAGEQRVGTMTDPDVRDAAVIAAAQHVEHYEIAGYGCARTHARLIGDDDAADLLQQTLDEEGDADKQLTDIAETINRAAAPERDSDASRRGSRLRYVDANDLDRDQHEYSGGKIRNVTGDEIGSLDGFLVDGSGRPYYLVVDTGGLFGGRRCIVPIGKATLDRSARAFTVGLDKDVLKRYPEFHRDAFVEMSDNEARRYEWRVLEAIDPAAARRAPRTWNYEQFEYYRQPEWADDRWNRSASAAGSRRAERDTTSAAGGRRERVPDRGREVVVASENTVTGAERELDRERRTRADQGFRARRTRSRVASPAAAARSPGSIERPFAGRVTRRRRFGAQRCPGRHDRQSIASSSGIRTMPSWSLAEV